MKRKLLLESLENRKLLAGDVGFASGVLTIDGTSADDIVVVSTNGGTLEVNYGGEIHEFTAGHVSHIRFQGHDGDDHFENNTRIATTAFGNLSLIHI